MTAVIIFLLTIANIVIVSLGAYRGVEYMDSVGFCGQVCHTAMKPEFVAHDNHPHARVPCVDCHVGAGAASFAKAKLAGTRRVLAVTFRNYPTPIKAAPDQLLASRDTCERCHWSKQFHGDMVRRIVEYANDEANTESATTLGLHVGGGERKLGDGSGIHGHMNPANELEYSAADADRQVIPYVRMKNSTGQLREYIADGAAPEDLTKREWRRIECTDCHNRPSHAIAATPERAVNDAMARGDIPTTLPFIHREAVKALKATYVSEEAGAADISRALRGFYQQQPPPAAPAREAEVERAVKGVQDVFRRNVFPDMKVGFGSYPNNIGHSDSPGCFRCHDDRHTTNDGRKIGQDCETCHTVQ